MCDQPIRSLAPGSIADALFAIGPDRDERASQIAMEALLTIHNNNYGFSEEGNDFLSPKTQAFAVRTIATGENFLANSGLGSNVKNLSIDELGEKLSQGKDFAGSENISLLREALGSLVDPKTRGGQPGEWLCFPFHSAFCWYDARKTSGSWTARKVRMRGAGVTFGRILMDPNLGGEMDRMAEQTICSLRDILTRNTAVSRAAQQIETLVDYGADRERRPEPDERRSWDLAHNERLKTLRQRLTSYANQILLSTTMSAPAKLWALRNLMAIEFVHHISKSAWQEISRPAKNQYLLATFGGPERRKNIVRKASEASYLRCRVSIQEAIISKMVSRIENLREKGEESWHEHFESRAANKQLAPLIARLQSGGDEASETIAREAYERATYQRPVVAFGALLDSTGMLAGTGSYRYLVLPPEVLAVFVACLSDELPMPSADFFDLIFDRWGIVIGPRAGAKTELDEVLDLSELARNQRRAEAEMCAAGLARSYSDSTTMVGER